MKIGRNAPCSCGSGKKYKKCCLNKAAVPPEKLQYRRLSEVHDKLLPILVEYGETVFGAMAPQVAFAEFLAWPDPEDAPDEAVMDRAAHLFWPWYVFNWEYRKFDDVDQLISGPEDMTITEHFLQKKKIAPESPEGRFLMAANRSLYSFHEIVSADAGHTVNIRDVLTGREVLVQEHMGSEFMEKGDLIFGRVVQVDNVSMFMGLSANKMPPRMIPEVIQLRRKLSGARGMLSLDDLYEWDLEIRGRFWDMDRRLHSIPKIVNTDGDPTEFHKLIYDIDSVEHAVKKLADLSKTESLAEIINDAEKDENGKIKRAVFSWSRKGNPKNPGMSNTILGNVEIKKGRLTVSVNSAERARVIRAKIENRLAAKACFRFDEISDMDAMMNQQGEYDDSTPSQEELLSHPEIRNQIEQMLRQHWEDWVDHKIPLLGNKTPRQAVKTKDGRESVEALLMDAEKLSANDPMRSLIEKELLDDVRRRLKLDKPLANKRANTDARKMEERIAQTKRQLSEFGAERLPDIYIEYCRDLCDAIADSETLNLHLGRVEIWAAAIVYAIARLNFLFSPETPNRLTANEICTRFGVKKSTVSNKATTILDILDIFQDNQRFCAPHVTRLFEFIEDEHGFIHPVSALASEEHSGLEPIPLKPFGRQPVTSKKVHEKDKKQAIHRDDKQLKLFPD
jgi:hypothetical protein